MSPQRFTIRQAQPAEAEALSEMAVRAAAAWGYPAAWREAWRDYLTIEAAYIRAHTAFVAEEHGDLLGFCALIRQEGVWTLAHHWVDPPSLGRGVGLALYEAALSAVREAGGDVLRVIADPQAAGFYERRGARRMGERTAEPTGRKLPIYEIQL